MLGLRKSQGGDELSSSKLFDQGSFYVAFTRDLERAKNEVIIESPFISPRRLRSLLPVLRKLARRKVRVIINTKPPEEQEAGFGLKVEDSIATLLELGVEVLVTGGHHRKLAIIDRQVLYEGSLNILSQNDSCEIMRRIHSEQLAEQMVNFIGVTRFIG